MRNQCSGSGTSFTQNRGVRVSYDRANNRVECPCCGRQLKARQHPSAGAIWRMVPTHKAAEA